MRSKKYGKTTSTASCTRRMKDRTSMKGKILKNRKWIVIGKQVFQRGVNYINLLLRQEFLKSCSFIKLRSDFSCRPNVKVRSIIVVKVVTLRTGLILMTRASKRRKKICENRTFCDVEPEKGNGSIIEKP